MNLRNCFPKVEEVYPRVITSKCSFCPALKLLFELPRYLFVGDPGIEDAILYSSGEQASII